MFTGIIQGLGAVRNITHQGGDATLALTLGTDFKSVPEFMKELNIGDSIAVNGACLTVTAKSERGFTAFVSAETLSKTNLNLLKTGDPVNLERALRMSDFLSGHLVLGHIDGQGKIREKTARAQSITYGVEVAEELVRYIVEKGSVAIDGISLTVNRCEKNRFYVNIIPHTAQMTTLQIRKIGDPVNIETDVLGKYVERFLQPRQGIDLNFLKSHGFAE